MQLASVTSTGGTTTLSARFEQPNTVDRSKSAIIRFISTPWMYKCLGCIPNEVADQHSPLVVDAVGVHVLQERCEDDETAD
jgi:hypothetical protein